MPDLTYVGKLSARPDAPDKAAGRAFYIQDLVRPGMLHGKIKFSTEAHARIRHIDTSRAKKLPGVRAVITAYDTPTLRIGFLRDNFALKRDKVRQYRDEIAAVAAIDPEIAREAVDLIDVEYEPLPAVFSPEEALREGAPLVHETDPEGRPLTGNLMTLRYQHESGDIEAAERTARHVVEGDFSSPLIQQSCLGTAGCIAEFDVSGNLTMWAKTQIPFLAQRDFNRVLEAIGLAGRSSRVIVPTLGGAFGTGLDTNPYEYIAILLAHQTGRPVKIVYNREEEFSFLSPRQSSRSHIVQGCDADGRLTFRRIEVLLDNGAYASWGATYPTVMMIPATSLYRVPAVRFQARLVYTNNTYCQAMRGYGGPEMTWAIESNLDDLAQKAGIDPVEFRLINCNRPGETTPMGLKVTTCGLKECLETTARRLEWGSSRNRGRPRGVGLAALVHVGGGGRIYRSDGGGVSLRLDDYGNVIVACGGVEMGQGLHSALTSVVAESLGVLPGQVRIVPTDTATCPWDVGTHASRGAFIACNAAIGAASRLKERILALAPEIFPEEVERKRSQYMKAHPGYSAPRFDVMARACSGSFELKEGCLTLRDAPPEPWLKLELSRFLRAVHFRGDQGQLLSADSFYEPPSVLPDWTKGMGNLSATYTYGVQGVEVEVDEETGEVKILRLVAVHDVGRVLEPKALLGQIYGALAQGVGYALYEQILTEDGRILNPTFRDYKIPTVSEMDFPIEVEFIETADKAGPFGAKGVGEPGLVPTAPAIANAIYNAVGVRVRDLPITPERMLDALREKRRTGPERG